MPVNSGDITLSAHQALRFNPNWEPHDRDIISDLFNQFADRIAALAVIPARTYVKAMDADGVILFTINAGYIYFRKSQVDPASVDHLGDVGTLDDGTGFFIPLTTHVPHNRHTVTTEPDYGFCPHCNMTLLPTGDCTNGCES